MGTQRPSDASGKPPVDSSPEMMGANAVEPRPADALRMPEISMAFRSPTRCTMAERMMPKQTAPAPAPMKTPMASSTAGIEWTNGSSARPMAYDTAPSVSTKRFDRRIASQPKNGCVAPNASCNSAMAMLTPSYDCPLLAATGFSSSPMSPRTPALTP